MVDPTAPPLTAQQLQHRYRQGDRHFVGANLRGESLRGLNLRGINLSQADLSHTDLRGTDFSGATLVGTSLVEAKTGSQRRWLLPKLGIAWALVGLSGWLSIAWYLSLLALFALTPILTASPADLQSYLSLYFPYSGLEFILYFLAFCSFLIGVTQSGIVLGAVGFAAITAITGAVGMVAIAVTIIVTITIWTALLYTMAFTPFSSTSVFLSLSMLTLVQSFELDEAYGISRKALKGEDLGQTPSRPLENLKKYLGNLTMGLALLFAIAVTVTALVIATAVVPSATASPVAAIVFSGMVVGIIIFGTIVALVACVHGISRQARGFRQIVENLRQWVRPLAVGLVAWGGTRFTRADLTDADFTRASLKGAHLYGATLTRTRFDLARQVNLARWGNSQPLP
jgi:hypothetical protein